VEISTGEYIDLLRCKEKLMRLENGGVDNWQWYDIALNPPGKYSLDEEFETIEQKIRREYE